MAKKKVSQSNQEKPQKTSQDIVKPQQNVLPAMDSEVSEKLENLKSLNQMLLKEAVERRQQVDSLILSKGSLESDLARSESEKEELKSELIQLSDTAVMLELERNVVAVFASVELSQKGEVIGWKMNDLENELMGLRKIIDENESEIMRLTEKLGEVERELGNEKEVSRRVSVERDNVKDELRLLTEEGKCLKESLIQLEERKREIEDDVCQLRAAYGVVLGEKEKGQEKIELILKEKDLIEKSLLDANKLMAELKEELHGVVREKERVQDEKNREMLKTSELENDLSRLKEMVSILQEDEEKSQACVSDLEKKVVEGEERENEMMKEIDGLVEERNLSQKMVEVLTGEKNKLDKNLEVLSKQVDDQRIKIDEMVSEKSVLNKANGKLDAEVAALQAQVSELESAVVKLKESVASKVQKIKALESDVGKYSCELDQVKINRDECSECLNEEKANSVKLMKKIEGMEEEFAEIVKAFGEAKVENSTNIAEKKKLERECENLKKEIASLNNTLTEAQTESDLSKRKLELAHANSELVLNILKETVSFCVTDDNDAADGGEPMGEETKPHVVEVEKIKNAFKKKKTKVENMMRQVELLQNSVEKAHKKKSFWTALSSATTLLAAVSVAYLARGH